MRSRGSRPRAPAGRGAPALRRPASASAAPGRAPSSAATSSSGSTATRSSAAAVGQRDPVAARDDVLRRSPGCADRGRSRCRCWPRPGLGRRQRAGDRAPARRPEPRRLGLDEEGRRSRRPARSRRPSAGRSQGSGRPGRMLLAIRFIAPASSAPLGEVDGAPAAGASVGAGEEVPAVAQDPGGDHEPGLAPAVGAVRFRRRPGRRRRARRGRPAASKRWVSTVSEPSRLQRRSPPSSASGGPSRRNGSASETP